MAHRLFPNFPRPPVYPSWKHNLHNKSISISVQLDLLKLWLRTQNELQVLFLVATNKTWVTVFFSVSWDLCLWVLCLHVRGLYLCMSLWEIHVSFRLDVLLHGLDRWTPEHWKQFYVPGVIYTFIRLEGKREMRASPERRDEIR